MLQIKISNDRQQELVTHDSGPIEFGRREKESPRRVVVHDKYVSRDQLRLTESDNGQVTLENLGAPFDVDEKTILETNAQVTRLAPFRLTIGYTQFQVLCIPDEDGGTALQTIAKPNRLEETEASLSSLGETPPPETLTRWFERLLEVQQSAAGSAAFYDESARAVVDLIGLDRGLVLLRDAENNWTVKAAVTRGAKQAATFSRSVLARVEAERRTFYQGPAGTVRAVSLKQVEAVVASPIFDPARNIVGIVYGSRDLHSTSGTPEGIRPLEAQVVQLLAGAVSAGLARAGKEAEAMRMRVQFEQFSSPELARELENNPNLLEGAEREITVLFSDIRGFSRISEQLGPRKTYELVGDIMDCLTNQVLDHGGVIIDYYGDGFAAMWNAPAEQPRHASKACEAAIAMRGELGNLNARWAEQIGTAIDIGVGIHTGNALVGNAGSRRRMKYGPRGHTVNLASRVEGATKHFSASILISGATHERLDLPLPTRRICQLHVVGIGESVEIYQVFDGKLDDQWQRMATLYEEALDLYEREDFQAAEQTLCQIDTEQDDKPTALLAERIAACNRDAAEFDPAVRLDSK